MEETLLQSKPKTIKKRKVKTWGDEGFVGKIQYGAFDYTILFIPQDQIKEEIQSLDDSRVFGAIDQFGQIIYIASDVTTQCKKATLLHELMHAIFLMNGSMYIGENKEEVNKQMDVQSELLVDRTANGVYEIIKRNPEVVRWLLK